MIRITTYGCREYLQRTGRINVGELEYIEDKRDKLMIADIQAKVAQHFQMRLSEMVSARRSRDVARPRQVAMYLCKRLTPRSLPEIGRKFGNRDHTTVIHAIKRIESLRKEDAELAWHVKELERELAA